MAGAAISEKNFIKFNAADQEQTKITFRITTIAWVNHDESGRDIAAADICRLEDGAGVEIFAAKCVTAGDPVIITGLDVTVTGLKAEDLTGGVLFVYGERI